jgi:hypothetical protein
VTSSAWLDIGLLLFGLAASTFIGWLSPPANMARNVVIALVCLAVGATVLITVLKDRTGGGSQTIAPLACARVFDKAHGVLERESPLAAPPLADFAFTPSRDLPGRVDLTLTWINPIPIHQSAIAMEGVYGQADPNDDFIDHTQPAAATGECWNWYHFGPRDYAQPRIVRLSVDELWPGQRYCFYTEFRTETGYSKPTAIRCETATWKPSWGKPARPSPS